MSLADLERLAIASDKLEGFLLDMIPEWLTLDSCEIEQNAKDKELVATVYLRSNSGIRCSLSMDVYGLKRSELRHLSDSIKKRVIKWYEAKGVYDVT